MIQARQIEVADTARIAALRSQTTERTVPENQELQRLEAAQLARLEALGRNRNPIQQAEFTQLQNAANLARLQGLRTAAGLPGGTALSPTDATELQRLEAARMAQLQADRTANRLHQPTERAELDRLETGRIAALRSQTTARTEPENRQLQQLEASQLASLQALGTRRTAPQNAEFERLQNAANLARLQGLRTASQVDGGTPLSARDATELQRLEVARMAQLQADRTANRLHQPTDVAELRRLETARLAALPDNPENAAERARLQASLGTAALTVAGRYQSFAAAVAGERGDPARQRVMNNDQFAQAHRAAIAGNNTMTLAQRQEFQTQALAMISADPTALAAFRQQVQTRFNVPADQLDAYIQQRLGDGRNGPVTQLAATTLRDLSTTNLASEGDRNPGLIGNRVVATARQRTAAPAT